MRNLLRHAAALFVCLATVSAQAREHGASFGRPGRRVAVGRRVVVAPAPVWVSPPRYMGFSLGVSAPLAYEPSSDSPPAVRPVTQVRAVRRPVSGVIAGELGGYYRAASLGLNLAAEGDRLGFCGNLSAFSLWAGDLAPYRTMGFLDGNLTFALLSNEHVRLRIEGGLSTAFFSDALMLGPTFGASAQVHLAGPMGVEASVSVTPIPFQKGDLRAGLWFNAGALLVRVGWRTVLVSDAGFNAGSFDGIARRDVYSGPSLSIGATF